MSSDDIVKLREQTGAGMLASKEALAEAKGDLAKAVEILRKKGEVTAAKKAGRTAKEGLIDAYIHAGGKVGVLVEVNCETDFVAKTDDFKDFVHEVALQVAATGPRYISAEDVPESDRETERDIIKASAELAGKPAEMIEKIVEGKLAKFYSEHCLLAQPYIKDDKKTVGDLLTELIARTGENVRISRMARFVLGEE